MSLTDINYYFYAHLLYAASKQVLNNSIVPQNSARKIEFEKGHKGITNYYYSIQEILYDDSQRKKNNAIDFQNGSLVCTTTRKTSSQAPIKIFHDKYSKLNEN